MSFTKKISIKESVFTKDKALGNDIRSMFASYNMKSFNIMGSIGAGKTSLLEKLSFILIKKFPILVINGDLVTSIDADRIKRSGATAIQINTGQGCHLDAQWIKKVLNDKNFLPDGLAPFKNGVIFIENVGNLICPANWDVGAETNIVVTSVTEGPYHVQKHPLIYKISDISVINKIDVAEAMDVDPETLKHDAQTINPNIDVIFTSCKQEVGLYELQDRLINR
ncbi:MAG: putative hydrogenase nickel incorporation protein HypB [Candidatus Heimdallarchaeota archaeon LC_3]|nr:MAG: putative hydrogenase nickel incorporation protein HypB [Candidatus Heimdallarchaeota archaeon LC_3]